MNDVFLVLEDQGKSFYPVVAVFDSMGAACGFVDCFPLRHLTIEPQQVNESVPRVALIWSNHNLYEFWKPESIKDIVGELFTIAPISRSLNQMEEFGEDNHYYRVWAMTEREAREKLARYLQGRNGNLNTL